MTTPISPKLPGLAPVTANRAAEPVAVAKTEAPVAIAKPASTFEAAAPGPETVPGAYVNSLVELPMPKNIDEAFDTMPSTASGKALIRRHHDNVEAWHSKWDIVTGAKQTLDFSYFTIERDAYGFAYMGALLDAQMRGVQVRGMTDYFSNTRGHGFAQSGLGADYAQELVEYGAQLAVYNDLPSRIEKLKHGLTYQPASANHDKFAVADAGTPNAIAETGGRNVARSYHQTANDNPESWDDNSVTIKGAVTSGFVTALERELNGPASTMVKKDLYNLAPRAAELLMSFQLMEQWMNGAPLSAEAKAELRANPAKREALADSLFQQAEAAMRAMPNAPEAVRTKTFTAAETKDLRQRALDLVNDLDLKGTREGHKAYDNYEPVDFKLADQVGVASAGSGRRHNELGPALFHLINGAQNEIVISNPYVVLTEEMMQAFEAASKRGVQIIIVTNSPESTDSAVTQAFFLNDWKMLLERAPTTRLFVALGDRKFHGKAFVGDGKVSGDTSFNADLLSGFINGEIGGISRSASLGRDLLQGVADDLANPANQFSEWTIKRDADGKAVRDEKGELIAERGPEHDVSPKLLKRYKVLQFLAEAFTKTKAGAPLAHPGR